jgi:serine/threonine protein kinase
MRSTVYIGLVATLDLYGLVGQVLDGQFRVDQVIGEGGFSVVYRGLHVGLDEPVAIKCLKLPTQLASPVVEAFVQRFRNESKIHYRLSRGSLHIARTIAAGTTMAPTIGALVPYMVLEWLDGYTLAEELRARRERGERGRTLKEVFRLLDPVADAMAFAHAQGVVHRDLNPSNIFVAHAHDSSKLKVLDFGVAKIVSDHALSIGPRAATIGQIRMFTPAYAAPEQFQDDVGPISAQTDVYSFAVVVVELLADKTPVEGEHIGDYADRALDAARRPTPRSMGIEVGDAVEAVIARAVSVDPAQRPQDIGEFWGMLKHASQRDQKARDGDAHGFPNSPLSAAPSAKEPRRTRATAAARAPSVEASNAAATLTSSSMPEDIKVVIDKPELINQPHVQARADDGAHVATVARVINVTEEPAPQPPLADARPNAVSDPPPARAWPSRGPSKPIPEGERPRWHTPSMPKAPELVRPSIVPAPKRRNFPLFIAIAIGLTVTFVVLAIVATELAR